MFKGKKKACTVADGWTGWRAFALSLFRRDTWPSTVPSRLLSDVSPFSTKDLLNSPPPIAEATKMEEGVETKTTCKVI